jgi:hypothetical protein
MGVVVTATSCATLISSKRQKNNIYTTAPCKVMIAGDTLNELSKEHIAYVLRSKKPITVTTLTDSVTKSVKVKSKLGLNYYLNIVYPVLWPGFLID